MRFDFSFTDSFLRPRSAIVAIVATAALVCGPAFGQQEDAQTEEPDQFEVDPYALGEGAWISIDGTVHAVARDSFVLDYGAGLITVEMDDGDRDADGYQLLPEDKVRVGGIVDDDLLDLTTIEARSVHVEKLGTTFFASPRDEEDPMVATMPVIVSESVLRGTVASVSEDSFVLESGKAAIRIRLDSMPYDPLDDEGYQRIEAGDRVTITGDIDLDFFEGRVFTAESIVVHDGD